MRPQFFSEEQKQDLRDIGAFIEFAVRTHEYDFDTVLRTLDHDVQRLGKSDPTSVPRTRGYFKRLADSGESVTP